MVAAVIVQARMASTRLPGKVLKPLRDGTVLREVLRRCRAIPGVDIVCCAVPESAANDPVAREAESCGAAVHRGHDTDVLDRYAGAARVLAADTVMRVTSDCPLIDPGLCGEVLAALRSAGADYACNNMPPSFPHGLDCEAFTAAALERASQSARLPEEREHVTPWLRTRSDIRRTVVTGPGGDLARQRWTLDYPEDYAFLVALFDLLPPEPAIPDWRFVADLVSTRPDLERINRERRQR
jgi:spore coat polysaccharide biosynthesis protein SpsF (cytidylyltransferase family)